MPATTTFLTKGLRVHVKTLVAYKPGTYSLAGAQAKVQAREVELTGKVAHVRGNARTVEESTDIGVWIEPDEDASVDHVEGLQVEAKFCFKCGRYEIGPFNPNAIQAVVE